MDIAFEKEFEKVRAIDSARNYWFIRTYRGALYETFYNEDFVAIGFNNVPYEYIKNARNSPSDMDKLKEYLANNYELEKSEVTKWANQLVAFELDVKLGDLVIIPNDGSSNLCVGVVRSNTKIVKSARTFQLPDKSFEPIPEKRKQIEWLKPFTKSSLFGDVSGLFSSHMALTNATKYSEIIESNLNSIFIKNERIYVSVRINQDEDINAFALKNFMEGLTYFYKEFCKDEGIEDNEDLFIKIKVQSKGGTTFSTKNLYAGFGVAALILLSTDPNLKFSKTPDGAVNFEVNTKSNFINTISDFLDKNQERKIRMEIFKDSMERLHATPSTVNDSADKNHKEEGQIGDNPKEKK